MASDSRLGSTAMGTNENGRNESGGMGERNNVAFHNTKDGMIIFTRRRKPELKITVAESRTMVRGHTMGINPKATRWLKVYLERGV